MICISCNREIELYLGVPHADYNGKCDSCRSGVVPTGDDKRKDVCAVCGKFITAIYIDYEAPPPN